MKGSGYFRTAHGGWAVIALSLAGMDLQAAEGFAGMNPIGKVARLFNPELVKIEDRLAWLTQRLSTLADAELRTMHSAYGFRGARSKADAPDPEIVVDLGSEVPVDRLFLLPSPPEPTEPEGLFPRRFSLVASRTADFAEPVTLFRHNGPSPYPNPDLAPVRIIVPSTPARYVKLVVHEGRPRGLKDLFALSEIVVFSGKTPISLGAPVTANSSLTVPGLWSPEYLTDGRSPLGIWQSGYRLPSQGDLVEVNEGEDDVAWSIDLAKEHPIDRLILFPYEISEFSEGAVSSGSFRISAYGQEDTGEERLLAELTGPAADMSGKLPLIIPLRGQPIRALRIVASNPMAMGERHVHGLSEIEVWSGMTNVAAGLPVARQHSETATTVKSLTDGIANQQTIYSLDTWLTQLNERKLFEQDLFQLRPLHKDMVEESELNATFGVSIALAMTFLIPVGIIERRRMLTKRHIEQLRKRIASDLHDDIGSNLGSISLIAHSARKDLVRLEGPQPVVEDLGEVELIARESSLAMRDIVWLLERRQDSIGDLVQRMRETASRLLREIEYTIECQSTKSASKLTLDAKRHLFLFYKEAIHNIVKHARASRVTVVLSDQDDHLILEIMDDGVGLPHSQDHPNAPVNKLQERARVLEGQLHIESKTGVGTALRLAVKRANLFVRPAIPV